MVERLHPICRQAVEVGERFADDLATQEEVAAVEGKLNDLWNGLFDPGTEPDQFDSISISTCACCVATRSGPRGIVGYWGPWQISATPADADFARDIFGNPFRQVVFDTKWRTEHTVGIAAKMYDEREFAAMPILADALEEAGCDNHDILIHCREPGVHVRGCWVVDLVLGKE
jgi:hypothetical protein